MRYVIYGAGGVGSAIGGALFQHGHEVILICRGEHLSAIQSKGLTLRTPAGTSTLQVPAVGHPRKVDWTADDVVILGMKSQDTESALTDLRASTPLDLPLIHAQNGVDNERMALRRYSRVYGMMTVLPATFLEPGVVLNHATPIGGVLDVGRYPSGVDELIRQVAQDLESAGFVSSAVERIMPQKYGKLLNNLHNGVVATCGWEADDRGFTAKLRAEAEACYRAAGIEYVDGQGDQARRKEAGFGTAPIEGEGRQGGSSWQSLMRGRPSIEADYMNGEIALLGRLHGVPTPCNEVVQEMANRFAIEGRQPGGLTIADLEHMVDERVAVRAR